VISVRPLQKDESNTYIINLPPNFGTNSSFNIKGTWLYVIGSNLSFIILLKPLSQYLYHWHKKKMIQFWIHKLLPGMIKFSE